MRPYHLLILCIAQLAVITGCASVPSLQSIHGVDVADATTQPASAAAPVRFSAIVPVGAAAKDDNYVWLVMQNVSKKPFHFVPGSRYIHTWLVRANGEAVYGGRSACWAEPRREDVKELKPGEQIEFSVYVGPAIYDDLHAGLYSVHARMQVTDHLQQKYGMTPVDIDQFVCHVGVPEPKPAATTAPAATAPYQVP